MTAKVGLMPIPEKALGEAMEKGGKKMKGTVLQCQDPVCKKRPQRNFFFEMFNLGIQFNVQ